MPEPEAPRDLIPEALKKPMVLLFAWIVPQLVLLLLNARGLWLVWGEMNSSEAGHFIGLLAMEVILLALGVALFLLLQLKRSLVGWLVNIPILAVHLGYLWVATAWIGDMLPASVTLWILPPERMMLHQYTFIMPALFYAAWRLACFPSRIRSAADWGLTLAATVGVPVAFYLIFNVVFRLFRGIDFDFPWFVIMLGFIGGTLIAVIGLLRLVALVVDALTRRGEHGMMVLAALVGVVCPQLGLLLNGTIPFPADFQSVGVYAMAALNGLLLLFPRTGKPALNFAVWLGRAALFPFTLYFFLVFLPYLPLSLLAIIAMGSGFLMLTPTALMALHSLQLWHGFLDHASRIGRRRCVALGLAAVAVIPALYTLQAVTHRVVVRDALAHVYASDPATAPAFKGSVNALRHVLDHLRAQDDGIELPYLAQYYDRIVFDNLTLPPAKREGLRKAFLGPEGTEKRRNADFGIFGSRRHNRGSLWRRAGSPPPVTVRLADVRVATAQKGELEEATLVIEMTNDTSQVSEFATKIVVPPGALVSDYALYIGKDRVPGQLFEKKAAMWVYRTIRDMTRRDPGLLLYKGPSELELRVYPFAAGEARTTEITLVFPAGSAPTVSVGDRTFTLTSAGAAARPAIVRVAGQGSLITLPAAAQAGLPSITRKPVLNFILDRSGAATSSLPDQIATAAHMAASWPDAEEARLWLANYDVVDATPEPIKVSELAGFSAERLEGLLPARGGLLADRAVRRAVIAHGVQEKTFPLVVVVLAPNSELLRDEAPAPLHALVPDVDGYVVCGGGPAILTAGFAARDTVTNGEPLAVHPVHVLKAGGTVAATRHAPDQLAAALVGAEDAGSGMEIFDARQDRFIPLDAVSLASDTSYGRGAGAWLAWQDAALHPSDDEARLAQLVEQSRAARVLLPVTAYIVVENSAQWNMLKLKEREKLKGLDALELKSAPEPATWLMLACLVAAVAWMRRWRQLAA